MARPSRIPLDQNRNPIYFVSSTDGLTPAQPQVIPGGGLVTGGGNTTGIVVAAGTITTQTNIPLVNIADNKLVIVVNLTAGAGNVTVKIDAVSSSGYVYNLLTSTALAGTGTTALRVFPGSTPSANAVANDVVPKNINITATVSSSITYGIDYILGA